jgi:hypothetical protein
MIGSEAVNAGVVGDIAKLLMHRLIVRRLRRDPAIIERAKAAHARQAEQFAEWRFVREWEKLLALPPADFVTQLISRDREMVRNSSPFYLVEDVRTSDYDTRIRISRAARRIVRRGIAAHVFCEVLVAVGGGGLRRRAGSPTSKLRRMPQDRRCCPTGRR